MSMKPVIQVVLLSIALCVTSLAYAAGGGSGKEAEPLGTEKDATPATKTVNKVAGLAIMGPVSELAFWADDLP